MVVVAAALWGACSDPAAAPTDAAATDAAAADAAPAPSCPAPSVPDGTSCVFLDDAQLTATMVIPADTTLDCRGHRLTPSGAGVLDEPRTAENEFQPSAPELAMFVHRSQGVIIEDCVLDGFDFGILVARAKDTGGAANQIRGNTISVRTTAIYLIQSDRVVVADNELTFASERGRGIVVEYDSDDNQITGNVITSSDVASTGQVREQPGGRFVGNSPPATLDNEIHVLLGNAMVRSLVINGELVQIAASETATGDNFDDVSRPDHILIEGNQLIDYGFGNSCVLDPGTACTSSADCSGTGPCLVKSNSGVALNLRASVVTVRGNTFSGTMGRGVSNGGTGTAFNLPAWTPGTCTEEPARLCSADSDCNIAGYDTQARGTCSGAAAMMVNGNTIDNVAEGNTLNATYSTAALYANNSDGFVLRGNTIGAGPGVFAAIRVEGSAINGMVERNIVRSAANALYLSPPATVTNTIQENDFTGYATAIRTSNDYTLATDLGGNYWSLPCPGLDASKVKFDDDTLNPNVTDSSSYGEPVATHAAPLPARCTP